MSHFERTLGRALAEAAAKLTDDQLAEMLADPTNSEFGLAFLQAELDARSGQPPRGLVARVLGAVSHEADVVVGARA